MVEPNIWGPHAWKFIHYITMSYPKFPNQQIRENYKNFFINLKNVLPCNKCSKHYEENLKLFPLTDTVLSSTENLINWGIDLHNYINKLNNKKVLSYKEAYELFDNDFNIKKIETTETIETIETFDNVYPKLHCDINYINIFFLLLCFFIFLLILYKK